MIVLINHGIRLALWSGTNFTGRRIVFRRGNVAVRDLRVFNFNDVLSSFRLRNETHRAQVTLILFEHINFRGAFRVFRGSQSVANLGRFNFNNVTSSFILARRILTDAEIARIRSTGTLPGDFLVIRQ